MKNRSTYLFSTTACFCILLYLIALCQPAFPVIEYSVLKEKIAVEKCVNKDVPNSTCNGQCYFKSQLEAFLYGDTTSEEEPAPSLSIDFEKYPIGWDFHTAFELNITEVTQLKIQQQTTLLSSFLRSPTSPPPDYV